MRLALFADLRESFVDYDLGERHSRQQQIIENWSEFGDQSVSPCAHELTKSSKSRNTEFPRKFSPRIIIKNHLASRFEECDSDHR